MKGEGMRRFLKWGLMLMAMAVLLLPVSSYAEIDISGEWYVYAKPEGEKEEPAMLWEFNQTGNQFTFVNKTEGDSGSGTLNGADIQFSITDEEGTAYVQGTVSGNQMTGTWSTTYGESGTWRGERVDTTTEASYEIDSNDIPCGALIWDLSGNYSYEFYDCEGTINMSQDSKGKITGTGGADCEGYFDEGIWMDLDLDWGLKGSIKQKDGIATVKLSMKLTGTVNVPDAGEYDVKGTEKITAVIDAEEGALIGTMDIKVSIKGFDSMKEKGVDFYEDLPWDMDGSWELDIHGTSDGKKMVGDSLMWLSNGDTLPFSAKGKYNSKSYETKFTLKGTDNASGCKLSPVINELTDAVVSMTGKVLGQSIKCK